MRTPITTNQFILLLRKLKHQGGVADVISKDLRQVDLAHPEVRELMEAIAERSHHAPGTLPICVDLTNSDISGCDLSYSDLSCFAMGGVRAVRTVFTGSDLSDVHLNDAVVDYADFRQAKLYFTKMYNTSIYKANFSGADLRSVYGLGMGHPGAGTVARLGQVLSLDGAQLPPEVEALLPQIATEMYKYQPETSAA